MDLVGAAAAKGRSHPFNSWVLMMSGILWVDSQEFLLITRFNCVVVSKRRNAWRNKNLSLTELARQDNEWKGQWAVCSASGQSLFQFPTTTFTLISKSSLISQSFPQSSISSRNVRLESEIKVNLEVNLDRHEGNN